MTFADFVRDWLALVRPTLRPSTHRGYGWACRRHLVPLLGDVELADIDRAIVRRAALEIRTRLNVRSQRLVLSVLRTILQAALDDEIVETNAASRPSRYLVRTMPRTRPALMGAQCRLVLDAVQVVAPHMFALFLTLARTGIRVGEALGMEWDHVDLDARVALICQQAWARRQIGPTKSGRSHVVDLSAQLVLTLRGHRRVTPGPYCFPGPSGHPYSRSVVRHWFSRALTHAGVARGVTVHSLRHGFASTLLARGEPLTYVQRALSHASPTITAGVYGLHLAMRRPAAVDSLDDD
jgi:integrase